MLNTGWVDEPGFEVAGVKRTNVIDGGGDGLHRDGVVSVVLYRNGEEVGQGGIKFVNSVGVGFWRIGVVVPANLFHAGTGGLVVGVVYGPVGKNDARHNLACGNIIGNQGH